MTTEVSLTAEQQLVLQTIYDRFRADGAWPPFITVDRPLRRTHGLDVVAILQSIPESLLFSPRPGGLAPTADDRLRLTLRGVAACQNGPEDIDRLFRLLRWFAQREVEFEPQPGADESEPRVTSEEVRDYLGLDKDDTGTLGRLYALLQIEHWGQGGSGSGPDGWFVSIGPNVWRFREVQTVEDFAAVRERWTQEGPLQRSLRKAADSYAALTSSVESETPQPSATVPPKAYYHVIVSTKSKPSWDEVRLDLTNTELISRFVGPYKDGRPIVINGTTVPIDDLAKIRITWTDQSAEELRPIVEADPKGRTFATPVDWRIAARGKDVTDSFITEPPGRPKTGSSDVRPPLLPRRAALYIDQKLIAAIKAKDGASQFDCTKLLQLIDELNHNYARENVYSTHALLRAILDHVPPILGLADFGAVASNYKWTQTDKKYMKRLLEFKNQADDALHRQISSKPDLLSFDDMPPRTGIGHLLQECADRL